MLLIFTIFVILFSVSRVLPTGLLDAPGEDEGKKLELVGRYSVYRKKLTWGDAAIFCEAHEGHLASFVNINDAKSVIDKIYEISEKVTPEYLSGAKTAEFGLDRRYWMALTDLVSGEGNWVWAGKGAPLVYNLWYPGQPDHIDKDGKYIGRPEHCGALWNPIFHKGDRKHSFVDQECKRKYYFICETDEDKLKTQQEWNEKNQGKLNDPHGRGLGALFATRGRHAHALPMGRGAQPEALGRSTNGRKSPVSKHPTKKTTPAPWKVKAGFKELYESSSSEEKKLSLNDLVKPRTAEVKKSDIEEDEVKEIFS